MRFVISGEWTKNSLLKLIILLFLGYIFLFWISIGLLFFHKMSLDYQSIVDYYLGSEKKFMQPRSYQSLLEISHFHLFSMGILMLTLTHLLLFVPLKPFTKAWLIIASFSSAILNEASSWLIRFVSPDFAYLKMFSFISLELSLLVLMLIASYALITKMPSAYTSTNTKRASKNKNDDANSSADKKCPI